ncbi:MAG TPA: hypothetical protein PKE62_16210 [Anaerolineales bacterium]|nr:hypothetical protein [Anaerolineales bacterium]
MTSPRPEPVDDDMLDEYDFSKGVRGKYVERFKEGSNIVRLSPNVGEVSGRPPHADKILEESTRAATKIVIGEW